MKLFFPWNYEAEQAALNARSEAGFQMTNRTVFGIREKKDSSKCYRYLFDCKTKAGYTELLYEKQGWEKVCSHGKWLWFRKEYDASLPPERYEIFRSDDAVPLMGALSELANTLDRIRNVLLVVTVIMLLISGFFDTQLVRLIALPLLLCIPLTKCAGKIRNVTGEEAPRKK